MVSKEVKKRFRLPTHVMSVQLLTLDSERQVFTIPGNLSREA